MVWVANIKMNWEKCYHIAKSALPLFFTKRSVLFSVKLALLATEPESNRLSTARQLTAQMMQNPQILAALQERLDGLNGSPSGYMER